MITVDEFWRVIRAGYSAGHFGPTAYPGCSYDEELLADVQNILHRYNAPYEDEEFQRKLLAPLVKLKVEELFAGTLEVTVQTSSILALNRQWGLGFEEKCPGTPEQ
jgi:hypothetical protein